MTEVNVWAPAEGCNACKDAKRIMDDMLRSHVEIQALAIKKIRSQGDYITELQAEIELLKDRL